MHRISPFLAALLVVCCPLFAEDKETPKMPLRSLCQMTTNEVQEARYCKIWNDLLKSTDAFRPAVGMETSITYHIMVMKDKDSDKVAVNTIAVFQTTGLNGFTPIIWNKLSILAPDELDKDTNDTLVLSLKAVLGWLPGAIEAIDGLCPDRSKKYRSVDEVAK
jgi:hypothetical protein